MWVLIQLNRQNNMDSKIKVIKTISYVNYQALLEVTVTW